MPSSPKGTRRRSVRAATAQQTAASELAAAQAVEEAVRVKKANAESKKELHALTKLFTLQMKGLGTKKRQPVDVSDLDGAMQGIGVKAKSKARAHSRRRRKPLTKKKKSKKKTSPLKAFSLKPASFSFKKGSTVKGLSMKPITHHKTRRSLVKAMRARPAKR